MRSDRIALFRGTLDIADSDFHPLEPAQRLIDAQALAPFFVPPARPKMKTVPVKICDNVWIGMNAMILKGVTVGEISCGSGISRDESCPTECRGGGESGGYRQTISP